MPKVAASSSAAAEELDEEPEPAQAPPAQAPPPSLASTSDSARRGKAFALDNKSIIFCQYPNCKRFEGASEGKPGQGFSHNRARDSHHATHASGGCDEFGKRAKKAK